MPRAGEVTPQVDTPGPISCALGRGGRPPPPVGGVSTWTEAAKGEGRCPLPCGPHAAQWNRGSPSVARPPEGTEEAVGGGEGRLGREAVGTAACGGRAFKGRARGSGKRPMGGLPLQTATRPGVMPHPPLRPLNQRCRAASERLRVERAGAGRALDAAGAVAAAASSAIQPPSPLPSPSGLPYPLANSP